MTIYTGPVFEMAREQFHTVCDYVGIREDERVTAAALGLLFSATYF